MEKISAFLIKIIALFQVFVALTECTKTTVFKVNIAKKILQRSENFGKGHSYGITVDDRESPELTLQEGHAYVFDASELDCSYPVFISKKSSEFAFPAHQLEMLTDNVVLGNGMNSESNLDAYMNVCKDGFINHFTFIPGPSETGKTFYLETSFFPAMGGKIKVVKETFCNKYSRIQQVSNYNFIEKVCNYTFHNLATSETGMLEFFTGEKGPFNYFVETKELDILRERLCAYFGNAFGCDDEGYPSYDGPDMFEVHAALEIGNKEFEGFNNALLMAMQMGGVEENDVAWAKAFLESFKEGKRYGVCNALDCFTSLCNKLSHSSGKTNYEFLKATLDNVFEKLSLKDNYFSPYLKNDDKIDEIKSNLISFYGIHEILSCSDDSFKDFYVKRNGKRKIPLSKSNWNDLHYDEDNKNDDNNKLLKECPFSSNSEDDTETEISEDHFPKNKKLLFDRMSGIDSHFFHTIFVKSLKKISQHPLSNEEERIILELIRQYVVKENLYDPELTTSNKIFEQYTVTEEVDDAGSKTLLMSRGLTLDITSLSTKVILKSDKLYRIRSLVSCEKQLKLKLSESDNKITNQIEGVWSSDLQMICKGNNDLYFMPPASLKGKKLFLMASYPIDITPIVIEVI